MFNAVCTFGSRTLVAPGAISLPLQSRTFPALSWDTTELFELRAAATNIPQALSCLTRAIAKLETTGSACNLLNVCIGRLLFSPSYSNHKKVSSFPSHYSLGIKQILVASKDLARSIAWCHHKQAIFGFRFQSTISKLEQSAFTIIPWVECGKWNHSFPTRTQLYLAQYYSVDSNCAFSSAATATMCQDFVVALNHDSTHISSRILSPVSISGEVSASLARDPRFTAASLLNPVFHLEVWI
ncbi:hypothetical protein B0H14DRAFT_2587642 [Mycena olivaceomarginata]|nr:hypothetical protein B0H14DRAFT_2587642 [Mycena olivaceomarginata]